MRNYVIYAILLRVEQRRTYKIKAITINGLLVNQVVIDAHYEKKHKRYMNDELILNLVQELNGRKEVPDSVSGPYSYFATLIEHKNKKYRLIWLLEDHAIYIGIINAYRDTRKG